MPVKLNLGFALGVFLFFSGLVLFLIGFSTPYWLETTDTSSTSRVELYTGLWMNCSRTVTAGTSIKACDYNAENDAEWLKAAQAMQCIALIGFSATCVIFLAVLCARKFRRHHGQAFEITAVVSTCFGLLGVAVYGGAMGTFVERGSHKFSWAFALDLAGLIIILVAGAVLALANMNIICTVETDNKKPPREFFPPYLEYPQRNGSMPVDYRRSWAGPQEGPSMFTYSNAAALGRSARYEDKYPHHSVVKAPYAIGYGGYPTTRY